MKRISAIFIIAALLMPLSLSAQKNSAPESITVMSYNIRVSTANDGTNSWQYRYPASGMMIDDQRPDVIGLQEAMYEQVAYLKQALEVNYKPIGVGRDDGASKGEHMTIFYNKKTVAVKKWGTFWLSDTPDKPSTGWDGAYPRTATWAVMKDKRSGKSFVCINTHIDHVGKEAQKNGVALIIEKLPSINPKGLPVVITGDFNMEINDPAMDSIKAVMKDSRTTAFKTDEEISYNGWGKAASTIDFIWYDGFSSCTEFETVTKPYYERNFISDHYPVKSVLVF